jgi:hypothetical protein
MNLLLLNPVPIDCLGNAEFAAGAPVALRDVVGHTLIFFGKQNGKNAAGHGGIGRVPAAAAVPGTNSRTRREEGAAYLVRSFGDARRWGGRRIRKLQMEP